MKSENVKLFCVACPEGEAKFKYMDDLYCTQCLLDKLLEDKVIYEAEYDPGIHGPYEED